MKKKLFSLSLAFSLVFSSIIPTFANTVNLAVDKVNLQKLSKNSQEMEFVIAFAYPQTKKELTEKSLKLNLLKGDVSVISDINISDVIENPNSLQNLGNNVTLEGNFEEENGKIKIFTFRLAGLALENDYKIKLTGKNYTALQVDNIDLTGSSKRININTATNFSLGDLNSDGIIDDKDLGLLESKINENNTQYDLNGDGKITVSDIAIINKNMGQKVLPHILDTKISPTVIIKNLDSVTEAEINKNLNVEGGSIDDIFKPNTEVKLTAKAGTNVVVPITFNKPEEMSSIQVKIPEGARNEDVTITIEDENGNIVPVTSNFVALGKVADANLFKKIANKFKLAKTDGADVVINLGKKVAVKKVTITVNKNSAGDYIVLEEVKFLKEVIPSNSEMLAIVKTITAKPSNESITLNWGVVPNVTGYKVYYGKSNDKLEKSIVTDTTSLEVKGLENLTTYYFAISATSNSWEGQKSHIISATPMPSALPLRPDFVNATAEDTAIDISWGKAQDAERYNVYIKKSNETDFTRIKENIAETKTSITNLENDIEYTLYVTSLNSIGESKPSELVMATPEKPKFEKPELPTKDRILNENIESISLLNKNGYDKKLYPNGFDPNWLIDNDFETTYVARTYQEENSILFNFKQPKDMDYFIWVPRLDPNYKPASNGVRFRYRDINNNYELTFWKEGDDLNGPGTKFSKKITIQGKDNSYHIVDFPKQEKVEKIKLRMYEAPQDVARVNASEFAFYEYNDIAYRVADLFSDNTFTALKATVTLDKINELEKEVSDLTGFIINQEVLLDEVNLAKKLLNGDNSAIGIFKNGIESIKPSEDKANYGISISDLQPLGLIGAANEKITIYAEIPAGEEVKLIATQYFEEVSRYRATPIIISNGRNQITIPKIGNTNSDRGGSLYITYSGDKKGEIKLHVRGGTKMPYLELRDLNDIKENVAKERIKEYIKHLEDYIPTLKGNLQTQFLNSTEISTPNMLLSVPASEILKGIKEGAIAGTTTEDEIVDKFYKNILAIEEMMGVSYKTYGIDDFKNNGLQTRHNIRYMKMFGRAFMYAAGNHVGIGFMSVSPLANGKPTSELTVDATENQLFGWGIAHEIGHIMDRFGKAEITNNIYSLILQTYDGNNNILPSRVESKYKSVFDKVSFGAEGDSNDVFVQLAMYWQLYLAYNDDLANLGFYNNLHKLYRNGSLNAFDNDDKFAVGASRVANKDLTEFFTRWGMKLSDAAKAEIAKLPKESRAIYYLTDESRRQKLKGNTGNTSPTFTARATINVDNSKEVNIEINSTEKNMQGYEIIRNGKSIGFTTTNSYSDKISSANNMAFNYTVRPIDILGNAGSIVDAGEVRIEYDNTLDETLYTENIKSSEYIAEFNEPQIITGIKITPKAGTTLPTTGNFEVSVKVSPQGDISPISTLSTLDQFIVAKAGDFSKNDSSDTSKYIAYLNKPATTDNKIWAYDAKEIKIKGFDLTNYKVQFISYPGDNVEFKEVAVGKLHSDYVYGTEPNEVIEAGTLIIVGKYRGNTSFNTIRVKGEFSTDGGLDSTDGFEERAINGYSLMFDEIPDGGKITSSTSDGLFIFVPDIQKEAELQGEHIDCSITSLLPTKIKAEIYRSEKANDYTNSRLTSDTVWISMPSYETLPTIEIK